MKIPMILWLALLPEKEFEEAAKALVNALEMVEVDCLSRAIGGGFAWSKTPSGVNHWAKLHRDIIILEKENPGMYGK